MIRRPTTFILGAGASAPYGLPLGSQLHRALSDANTYGGPLLDIFRSCGNEHADVKEFYRAFGRSSLPSIDSFLARRTDFAEIGKLAIASQIIARESPDFAFAPNIEDNWFGWLWDRMTFEAHDADEVAANDVRFITFNYDRALEYLLFEGFKHAYGARDEQSQAYVERVRILHVYGDVGRFHHAGGVQTGGRQFRPDYNHIDLPLAAHGIRVIEEARADDDLFRQARLWVEECELLCFLGFGFDRLNMERLALHAIIDHASRASRPISVCASVYQKTKVEILEAQESIVPNAPWQALDMTSKEFLRNVRFNFLNARR